MNLDTPSALHLEGVRATAEMRPAEGERLLRAALRRLPRSPAAATQALRGRILLSLAHAQAEQGRVGAGLRVLARAEALLPATDRGVLYGQRALMLLRTGRDDLALPQFDAAVATLDMEGEPEDLARALLNRAVLHLGAARVRRAREDLARCADVAGEYGLAKLVAKAQHNLAYLDFLAGDLPRALSTYGRVAERYAELMASALPVLAVDRARALLAAGLFGEADAELAEAIERFGRQRLSQDHAEATLARAEAAVLAGQPEAARQWARQAHRRFVRRGNARWAALADLCRLRAEFDSWAGSVPGAPAPADPALARPVPAEAPAFGRLASRLSVLSVRLDGLGLTDDAHLARAFGVRARVRAGRRPAAGRDSAAFATPPGLRFDARLQWRLAQAEVAAANGRPGEANRRRRDGLGELLRYRSRLGCLDLQTSAAVHGRELADQGLRAAIAAGRPAEVYRWSERARAQALLLAPVLPPADPEAAAIIEELRQVHIGLRQAELSGRPTAGLRARRAALQRALREREWGTPGSGRPGRPAPLAAVRAELGSAAMMTYLRDGPVLRALVVADGQARLLRLGDYEAAARALLRLRADLDAQAGRALPPRLAETVRTATRLDVATVQDALLSPLLPAIGDRDLVVVPTGVLVTTPWGVLPACAGRPVTVAPSATTWIAARQRADRSPDRLDLDAPTEPALLVAGPGNAGGEDEIRTIAALRRGSTVLTGADATPAATLRGMDAATVVHIAAHGHHQTDNPLFSTLELSGGPITGHDLQRLSRPPALVVLSSCDLGLAQVRPGDEPLGMAAALLSVGTHTVIASVSRVADDTAMGVMTRYHRAATAGQRPAVALAKARSPDRVDGFICLGAG